MAAEVEGQFAGVDVVLRQEDTRVFVDGRELGTGLLSVEESNLCWRGRGGSESLTLEYPSVVIHAVSRDTASFPHHCVYLQYLQTASDGDREGEEEIEGEGEEEIEGEGEGEYEDEVVEYRLVPPSSENLDEIYQAITHCQTLYPDPDQSDSDEQGPEEGEGDEEDDSVNLEDGDFLTTAEGLNHLSPEGFATLSHLERILQLPTPAEFEATVSNGTIHDKDPPDQFKDADK